MPNAQKPVIGLFLPLKLGPYELPNRMVMAPLTRNRAGPGNVPQEMNAVYYAQRASAGLIISEATQVSPQGVGYPHTPGIHNKEQVAGWQRVTAAIHERGGRIFLQLWHVGRISHPSLQPGGALPVAPSAIRPTGQAITYQGMQPFVTPRALAIDEIPDTIGQFRSAARYALEAGFDGVEIHAANGYLLDQFLRDGTNQRTDAYGGSLENRTRLLGEVTEAVASVWGSERVGVRLSPLNPFNDMYDSHPEETFSYAVEKLNPLGLAYLHVVESKIGNTGDAGPGFDTRKLRDIFTGLYMANGGYDRERAEAVLAAGEADLISFGTLFIANPDLPERFARYAPLNAPDPETFYGGNEKGYTDYPFLES
ncbi:NADH:flavin oxidoreductase/NADH oxidase [Nitrosococcus halophilus Nc 4]|uniref:NADH:flavin oxidoreductase/NADH oxidase n=1 Tax=Nitrosococcus halophilus (strain Nc4) TaxID=472759 RepID=D5C1N0_NITHN|nr:alkene reductase [Nitrosococcus halophilus]ADE14663.1 NADH:flavin oxidoreductase/NADH oxidase [Nitrosococcus halophilus Nc 4]